MVNQMSTHSKVFKSTEHPAETEDHYAAAQMALQDGNRGLHGEESLTKMVRAKAPPSTLEHQRVLHVLL